MDGGICSEPFTNMFMCSCKLGFTGLRCENEVRVCDSSPCMNKGICSQIAPNQFQCYCLPGFTGKLSVYLKNVDYFKKK